MLGRLIRLQARREAHAIVAGAAGEAVGSDRIAAMTELLSDFADVVDGLRPSVP